LGVISTGFAVILKVFLRGDDHGSELMPITCRNPFLAALPVATGLPGLWDGVYFVLYQHCYLLVVREGQQQQVRLA
jgi:hypothetical protein